MPRPRYDVFIQQLVRDLKPVRPIPRLRWITAAVICVWAATTAFAALVLGVEAPRTEGRLLLGLVALYTGLGTAGVAGVVAALAAAIPGREGLTRRAAMTAALALALAAGVATGILRDSPLVEAAAPPIAALRCLAVACLVASLPAIGVIGFGAHARTFRPLVLTLAAAAGTAALGGIAAKTTCPYGDLRHLMLGHVLAPAAGALLLTLPLLLALRRLQLRGGNL